MGEVVGSGSSVAVDSNGAARNQQALTNAMSATLRSAGMSPKQIGHLHAHGIATRRGDIDESHAIRHVFADDTNGLPVAAAKSYFGNLGAASGMVELICSLMAIHRGRLYPFLNFKTSDPDCPIRPVVDDATPAGDSVLNVSCTPQGQASAVVVSQPCSD